MPITEAEGPKGSPTRQKELSPEKAVEILAERHEDGDIFVAGAIDYIPTWSHFSPNIRLKETFIYVAPPEEENITEPEKLDQALEDAIPNYKGEFISKSLEGTRLIGPAGKDIFSCGSYKFDRLLDDKEVKERTQELGFKLNGHLESGDITFYERTTLRIFTSSQSATDAIAWHKKNQKILDEEAQGIREETGIVPRDFPYTDSFLNGIVRIPQTPNGNGTINN